MVAGCGAKFAKILLFVFNLCLWLCSLVLIGGGSYFIAKQSEYADLFEEHTITVIGGIVVGVGCFTFLVAFSGCCGALKESPCLLKTYWFFVLIIILAEITAGIMAFVYDDKIEKSMTNGMTKTINESYGLKDGATETVDEVQKSFKCCGALNYTDYKNAEHLTTGFAVPKSCCKSGGSDCTTGSKGEPTRPDLVFSEGCVDAALDTVKDHYLLIGAIALGVIVFEILTMVFACCVISGIQNNDYEKYA